ncbi:MAG: aminomethyl-transferring glycine dehydrogenase subunit GcvPA [Gammaproteobacteria bacterium]|nr:aminomethyl-transferring glycine dehydrogenase subunit GcvPA [Gammaproteobacteria bacterium]
MPFIPHTHADKESMLDTLGIASIDDLFDEIPKEIQCEGLPDVPDGISEMAMLSHMAKRARDDSAGICFLGAGCYDHYIPSAVWDIASRGEFLTAYTPYQAEASQGTLQLVYEFQTMLASLTSMDVANASVYDGASALAEAILMAVRVNRKSKSRRVLVPASLHPFYLATVRSIVTHQDINVELMALEDGLSAISDSVLNDAIAVVVQQPNFFGLLEDVDALTTRAHDAGALVIGVVNPMTLALLKPPGDWGDTGADIVCGDGQPLGIPMASGGPSFGFLCTRMAHVRQLPGRIAGRTQDKTGNWGFVLTLQAREQHIRRAKATSNICTNQGLLVTAATIYMTLLGPQGLNEVASACVRNTHRLAERLTELPNVSMRFDAPYFHECVLDFEESTDAIQHRLLNSGILGGYPLTGLIEKGDQAMLICATETRTDRDIESYYRALSDG